MNKTILVIYMMALSMVFSNLALAQDADRDREPFLADGPRSAVTGTVHPQRNDGWGRDPFIRPFAGTPAVQQVHGTGTQSKKLSGIIYRGNDRIAIIDGETIREGDRVGDQKLAQIRPDSVLLMDSAGNTTEVILEKFSIQK